MRYFLAGFLLLLSSCYASKHPQVAEPDDAFQVVARVDYIALLYCTHPEDGKFPSEWYTHLLDMIDMRTVPEGIDPLGENTEEL